MDVTTGRHLSLLRRVACRDYRASLRRRGINLKRSKSRYFPGLGRLKCPDFASYRPLLCPDLQDFDSAWTEKRCET